MNHRLIYAVGPSGAGKDSLLNWLRRHPPAGAVMQLARRTITRAPDAGDEGHEPVSPEVFERLVNDRAFALHWRANGLGYGIRHAELAPLALGCWLLVSGSRAHLPEARAAFPGLTAVHITASPDTLRQRLIARGRESQAEVQARLQRALAFEVPGPVLRIANDSDLPSAGQELLAQLRALAGVHPR